MGIQIHPNAATSFNEAANRLLQKVGPKPHLVPLGEQIRPQLHPVATIPEQDIIGSIRDVVSLVNGAGDEVGRFFDHDGHKVGLVGKDFEAFTQLVERLHAIDTLREAMTSEFLRNAAFQWLESSHCVKDHETFTDFVLGKAERSIDDFEIWIPLFQTYLESPIVIDRVTLHTIAPSLFEPWPMRAEQGLGGGNEPAAAKFALARERSQVQSCAAAVVMICAEESKAVAVAR